MIFGSVLAFLALPILVIGVYIFTIIDYIIRKWTRKHTKRGYQQPLFYCYSIQVPKCRFRYNSNLLLSTGLPAFASSLAWSQRFRSTARRWWCLEFRKGVGGYNHEISSTLLWCFLPWNRWPWSGQSDSEMNQTAKCFTKPGDPLHLFRFMQPLKCCNSNASSDFPLQLFPKCKLSEALPGVVQIAKRMDQGCIPLSHLRNRRFFVTDNYWKLHERENR